MDFGFSYIIAILNMSVHLHTSVCMCICVHSYVWWISACVNVCDINQKNAMILQKVQNMAFKSILKVPKRTSTLSAHTDLNMLTLSQRRTLHVAKEMYKIDMGLCPESVLATFDRRSSITNRTTRSSAKGCFEVPNYRLIQTRRNFVYRGIKTWKQIPEFLKHSESVDTFVSNMKQWLLDGDVGIT